MQTLFFILLSLLTAAFYLPHYLEDNNQISHVVTAAITSEISETSCVSSEIEVATAEELRLKLQKEPDSPALRTSLAVIEMESENFEKALDLLSSLPDCLKTSMLQAKCLEKLNRPADVLVKLNNDTGIEASLMKSKACRAIGDIEKAAEHLAHADRYVQSAEIKKELGFLYFRLEKYQKAIQNLQYCSKISADDCDISYTLGLCYRHQKDFRKAAECFNSVTSKDSRHHLAWKALGDTYLLMNETEKAAECHEKAALLKPVPDNLISWADSLNRIGKNESAIKIYRKAFDITGDDSLFSADIRKMLKKGNASGK